MVAVYVTQKGLNILTQRLSGAVEKLKQTQSQKAEAAEIGGDNWHDNFAFEELLRQETMLNAQIAEIRKVQDSVQVVEGPRDCDSLQIGHLATLENEEGEQKSYVVGGYGETDLKSDPPTLEYNAPMIKAFLGMPEGVEMDIIIRGRSKTFMLTKISKVEEV